MLKYLFIPKGRISPSDFMKCALFMIVLGFVGDFAPKVNQGLGLLTLIIAGVSIYMWFCLCARRLHQGGQSAWWALFPIVIYGVLIMISASLIMQNLAGEEVKAMEDIRKEYGLFNIEGLEKLAPISESVIEKTTLVKSIVYALLSLCVAFFFNKVIYNDPDENDFGPAV